jgi:hypothetical protein
MVEGLRKESDVDLGLRLAYRMPWPFPDVGRYWASLKSMPSDVKAKVGHNFQLMVAQGLGMKNFICQRGEPGGKAPLDGQIYILSTFSPI